MQNKRSILFVIQEGEGQQIEFKEKISDLDREMVALANSIRTGPSTQKLRRDEIIALINQSGKICFDESINEAFHYPSDFSKEALIDFLKLCGITTKLSQEDILINLNVAKKINHHLAFTNATILFFAKQPQKFFPESYITAVRYASGDRFSIIDKQDIYGNLIQQIELTMQFILRNIAVQASIGLTRRENIYEYPLIALREAIVNAVTHRDYYYNGSHIYIHIYSDRIEIENPGGLYTGLTLDNLGKRSVRRNRLIADLLHHAKYIERVGSGFDRMKHELSQNNNPPLEVAPTNFFNIRFYKRIPDISVSKLTKRQIEIFNLFPTESTLTKKDVATILNVSDDTAIREINALIKLKLIKKSGRGKAITYSRK